VLSNVCSDKSSELAIETKQLCLLIKNKAIKMSVIPFLSQEMFNGCGSKFVVIFLISYDIIMCLLNMKL